MMQTDDLATPVCNGCSDSECALNRAKDWHASDEPGGSVPYGDWPRTWGVMINSQKSWRHAESLIKLDLVHPISSESVDDIHWVGISSEFVGEQYDKEVDARDRCWMLLAGKPGVILLRHALGLVSTGMGENRRMKLLMPVLSSWKPLWADPKELTSALRVALAMDWKVQARLGSCLSRELKELEGVISQTVPKCPLVLITVISYFLIPPGWESFLTMTKT